MFMAASPPGGRVRLLAVDRQVAELAAVLLNEPLALDKETTRTHGRVVHAAFVRFKHFDNQRHNRLGRKVLPALFALGERKLAQEVFIHVAQDILGFEAVVLKRNGRDQVDQAARLAGSSWSWV